MHFSSSHPACLSVQFFPSSACGQLLGSPSYPYNCTKHALFAYLFCIFSFCLLAVHPTPPAPTLHSSFPEIQPRSSFHSLRVSVLQANHPPRLPALVVIITSGQSRRGGAPATPSNNYGLFARRFTFPERFGLLSPKKSHRKKQLNNKQRKKTCWTRKLIKVV
jgi:hypothetical protein